MKYLLFFILVTLSTNCYSQTLIAIDGDTISVNGEEVNIRGIDAPELNQPYGSKALAAVQTMLKSSQWKTKGISNIGAQGRFAAFVNKSGVLMSEVLVSNGLAWSSEPKTMIPSRMQQLMATAKNNRKHLWSDKNPVNPAMWRKYPSRYTSNFAVLAETINLEKKQRQEVEAKRVAEWNHLVATNPELAQQIIAEREQKKRDRQLLGALKDIKRKQKSIATTQEDIKSNQEDIKNNQEDIENKQNAIYHKVLFID